MTEQSKPSKWMFVASLVAAIFPWLAVLFGDLFHPLAVTGAISFFPCGVAAIILARRLVPRSGAERPGCIAIGSIALGGLNCLEGIPIWFYPLATFGYHIPAIGVQYATVLVLLLLAFRWWGQRLHPLFLGIIAWVLSLPLGPLWCRFAYATYGTWDDTVYNDLPRQIDIFTLHVMPRWQYIVFLWVVPFVLGLGASLALKMIQHMKERTVEP